MFLKNNQLVVLVSVVILVTTLTACNTSHSTDPISPDSSPGLQSLDNYGGSKINLGLWQFTIDPDNQSVAAVPLRTADLHMNGLSILEPPRGVLLYIDQVVDFSPGEFTIDIAIKHPFTGLDNFTAFDVCGILIGNGEVGLSLFPYLTVAGPDDVRLLNPDGYTRWWNPSEFPFNPDEPSNSYVDGLLGTPDTDAGFTATLNGYKYFASDLPEPDDPLSSLDINMRGALVAGSTAIRRYRIAYSPGALTFNYAINANWVPPAGEAPFNVPDDFPYSANMPEAYRMDIVDMDNSLVYDTSTGMTEGIATFKINCYSWYTSADLGICVFDDNGAIYGNCSFSPSGGTDVYSTYTSEIWPVNIEGPGPIDLWISLDSVNYLDYNGVIPGGHQATFFQEQIEIGEK